MSKTLIRNIGCLLSGDIHEPILSADSVLIETHHFCFPAAGFCIFHIHTVNLCRK